MQIASIGCFLKFHGGLIDSVQTFFGFVFSGYYLSGKNIQTPEETESNKKYTKDIIK